MRFHCEQIKNILCSVDDGSSTNPGVVSQEIQTHFLENWSTSFMYADNKCLVINCKTVSLTVVFCMKQVHVNTLLETMLVNNIIIDEELVFVPRFVAITLM